VNDQDALHRLHEETARRLAELQGPHPPPPRLARRVRTRQALTSAVTVAIAVVVVSASLAFVKSTLRHSAPPTTPTVTGPEGERTSFVFGTRVTYPRTWSLLQLSGRGAPAPLFQVSNFRPSAAATLGCDRLAPRIPPRGVLMVVGQDRSPTSGLDPWPVRLHPEGGGCFTTPWSVRGVDMDASMVVGPRARLAARQEMLDVFHSIRFPAALRTGVRTQQHASASRPPMFVVTSGYVTGRPASYLARTHDAGVCLEVVVGPGPEAAPCRPIRMRGHIEVLGTGPWAVVAGVVSRGTVNVEAELAGGQTVIGEVVPAPPLLGADFNFFVVELPAQSRGMVTALDGSGKQLGRRSFGPPPLPMVARGGAGDTRWTLLDREQSNGVRCIDFDKGHGDQATFCPAAVPSSRDVQATVVPMLYGRQMVVGVASERVAYVQVQYLTPRFVPAQLRSFPRGFEGPGAVLPPTYRVFTAPVRSIDGAIVVAYDRDSNPIDGMPLEAAEGFGG
jgi:hypothetical protein